MNSTELKILDHFIVDTSNCKIIPFGNGHINNTYKVENNKGNIWLLQKINISVFKDPECLIKNHLELNKCYDSQREIDIPKLINENSNQFLFGNEKIGHWRLLNFFKDTTSIENVTNIEQAEEAGSAFGSFIKGSANCNIKNFKEVIPDFHNLTSRYQQFEKALQLDKVTRKPKIKELIQFFESFYRELQTLESEISNQRIPIRIVHNDTKINNLLFRNNSAVAVIDLDTVGPGNILYDYGDALRTLANETDEDQQDLSQVKFSLKWFSAFTKSYLIKVSDIISESEKKWLWQAPFLMTYIMGIRFLTDYLNGDIYYKIKYEEQNLVRAKVQRKLLEDMFKKKENIVQTITTYLHNL